MPEIQTTEFKSIFSAVIEKFQKSNNLILETDYTNNFEILAEQINEKLPGLNIKGETLYKNIYLKLRKYEKENISYSKKYLNGLTLFLFNETFEEYLKRKTQLGTSSPSAGEGHPMMGKVYVCYNSSQQILAAEFQKSLNIYGNVELSFRDCNPGALAKFYSNLGQNDIVISLVNRRYWESENCMGELIDLFNSPSLKRRYFLKTIHTIAMNEDKELQKGVPADNIFNVNTRLAWLKYWAKKEEKFSKLMNSVSHLEEGIDSLEKERKNIAKIRKQVLSVLREITEQKSSLLIESIHDFDPEIIIQQIHEKVLNQKEEKETNLTLVKMEQDKDSSHVSSFEAEEVDPDSSSPRINKKQSEKRPSTSANFDDSTRFPGIFSLYSWDPQKKKIRKFVSVFFQEDEIVLKSKRFTYKGSIYLKDPNGSFSISFSGGGDQPLNYRATFQPAPPRGEIQYDEFCGECVSLEEEGNPSYKMYLIRDKSIQRQIDVEEIRTSPLVFNSLEYLALIENESFCAHFEKELVIWREKSERKSQELEAQNQNELATLAY